MEPENLFAEQLWNPFWDEHARSPPLGDCRIYVSPDLPWKIYPDYGSRLQRAIKKETCNQIGRQGVRSFLLASTTLGNGAARVAAFDMFDMSDSRTDSEVLAARYSLQDYDGCSSLVSKT